MRRPGYTNSGIPVAKQAGDRRWQGYAEALGFDNEAKMLETLYKTRTPREIGTSIDPKWPLTPEGVKTRMRKLGLKLRGSGGVNHVRQPFWGNND